MSKKTIKANSINTTHGHIEFEQSQANQIIDIAKQQVQDEPKFSKELIVKSKCIAEFHLHPDVIRAILVEPEYTLSNAKLAIQKYIDSFNHKEV